ncbi:MAG: hypothetical protein V1911_01440 [Candidatus Micrarchaeota archaeon]
MKGFLIISMFVLIFAGLGLGSVPGYTITLPEGDFPIIDGYIDMNGEWNGAGQLTMPNGPAGPVTVYYQYVNSSYDSPGMPTEELVYVYFAFHIPDSTVDWDDNVEVGIDGWHDHGSSAGSPVAPKADDILCQSFADNVSYTYPGIGGSWDMIDDIYSCWGATEYYGTYRETEVSIYYDGDILIPFQTNGLLLRIMDLRTPDPVNVTSWPPSPNGNMMDLTTWGDMLWAGADVMGSLNASAGSSTPENHNWYYDPDGDPNNEMIQFKLAAANSDVNFTSITLFSAGTGNDSDDVASALLIYDANANGLYDEGEQVLATGSYAADNGQLTMNLEHVIPEGTTHYFVIVYQMGADVPIGSTFSFTVFTIVAMDMDTGAAVGVMGMPLTSAVKTTMAAPVSVSVSEGTHNPGNHTWYYNASANAYNTMLQFDFTASGNADARIDEIGIKIFGTGNTTRGINIVYLVLDVNNNGKYDSGDVILGSTVYNPGLSENPLVLIEPFTVPEGETVNLLLVFGMRSQAEAGGTFSIELSSMAVADTGTGEYVEVDGIPLMSKTKKIIESPTGAETCAGNMNFTINPGITDAGSAVETRISGYADECSGVEVAVKKYSCANGTLVCTIELEDGTGDCEWNAPADSGAYLMYGCADLNEDEIYSGASEVDYSVLIVLNGEINCSDENLGGCINETGCEDTGGHWCDGVCHMDECTNNPIPECGDNVCSPLENCHDCEQDCGCADGQQCINEECEAINEQTGIPQEVIWVIIAAVAITGVLGLIALLLKMMGGGAAAAGAGAGTSTGAEAAKSAGAKTARIVDKPFKKKK